MFFYAGLISQTAAQGLRNEGAIVNIASGCYVVCQGGFNNSSGAVTNDGTLTIAGPITNSVSAIIEGDGSYNIGGDLINNGTFTQAAGTTTFNGNVAQTVSGSSVTTFNDLVIDGSGTTIAAGAMVTVEGSNFSPNGKLTINSDAVNNSGSLIYSGSGTPTSNVTYNRLMPAGSVWHYVSSPVNLTASPAGSFYAWDEEAGDWDANPIASNPEIGRGYTLKTTGNSVSFTGLLRTTDLVMDASSPYKDGYIDRSSSFAYGYDDINDIWNTGDIWAPDRSWTNYGGGGFNLMGNPYTSAINVSGFAADNSGQFDPNYVAVYLYDGNSYWFIGSPIDGWDENEPESITETHIQAGQGFFVLALNDGSTFTFKRSMQEHNADVSLLKSGKTGNAWPGFRLKAKYDDNESSTLVVYNEQMTAGLDPGYDVGQFSTGPEVEIYTTLVEKDNSVNFVRQALPVEGCEMNIIPVGIDSEKGGEVTFSAYTVPLGDNKFWLEDRKAGTFTDLNNNTYTVTLPSKTYGTGRFFIITSANTPTGIEKPQADEKGIRVWTSNEKVIIKGEVSDRAICTVYDMRGQKIVETLLNDGELNTVSLPSDLHGVYLVRVVDGVKVTTRKVVLL